MAGRNDFLDHVPALIAAALGAVGTSVGLSYFGVAGTLIGLTLGTIVTGALAWWAEWLIRRASARAKALAAARRRQGRELSPEETSFIAAVADDRHKRNYRPPWQTVVLGLSAIFVAAGAILVVVALGAGRPVGAIVKPPAITHTTPPPPLSPTTAPPSTVFSTPATPDAVPSPSPSATTPLPSPTPSAAASTALPPTVPPTVPAATADATP